MKTTENNLEQNIKKALIKAKTLLKDHSPDWYADILVYKNGFVTVNKNAPGATDQQIYKFGVDENAEIWGAFKTGEQNSEINVKAQAALFVNMLGYLSKQQEAETVKSKYTGMTDEEIEGNIKTAVCQQIKNDLVNMALKNPDDANIILKFSSILGFKLEDRLPSYLKE